MACHQIIYASRPFGFDDASLNGILTEARRYNAEHDITGALICRPDLYLQLLEGPEEIVESLYRRIVDDNRHVEVEQLLSRAVDRRMFPDWAMLHDPAQSWLWSADEVSDGAIKRASKDEIVAVFERSAKDAEH
ncbi:MAG: BLUF domain-containing protein [Sphingomonadales bacterium]|nr:BLUF domain-containing protein [Sphingomonadales bacterium]NCO47874.1 BLUF domain-containing protein [Sphingomonadales bacterium]NCO99241.1 BLUF domain-containing protein [Sphingomonadales bacterium]NCP27646.1 BLUF domain-containing protein [Sphingomonadales bacterium]NCP42196.1 BLUF domain-containing protein [Sphingomonadales bacterium]